MSQDQALSAKDEKRHSWVGWVTGHRSQVTRFTQFNNKKITLALLAKRLRVKRMVTFYLVYSPYSRILLPFSETHWRPPEDSCIYQSLVESSMSWNVHQSRRRLSHWCFSPFSCDNYRIWLGYVFRIMRHTSPTIWVGPH